MRRILTATFVSMIAAVIAACAPASSALTGSRSVAASGRPARDCPPGMVWDRGECRPQRGIVIEQKPIIPTPVPTTVPTPVPTSTIPR